MDQKLSVRAKITKLLEENMVVNLHDFGYSIGFLDLTPKAEATTTKWINCT